MIKSIKSSIAALTLVLAFTATTKGAAQDYTLNTEKSIINWTGSKPIGTHSGTLSIKSGSYSVKDGLITSGEFTLDLTSINVTDLEGDEKGYLEGHLKGTTEGKEDHFFDVANHPTGTFKVTSSEKKGEGIVVTGDLTLKGKTHSVSFMAGLSNDGFFTKTFTINRTKWGINYGSKSIFDNLGDKFIDDDIKLSITVVGTK